MSGTNKRNEDEIDLGSLFTTIGDGFSKLFQAIKTLFNQLFRLVISILLFIKVNFLKIVIAGLLGASIGLYLDFKEGKLYESTLQVHPNFYSAAELYKNIKYYNNLVEQENVDLLAETFNISREEAASLKSFQIKPVKNENDILEAYDKLIKGIDTISAKQYPYNTFKKSYSIYNYNIHNIKVLSTKNDIFKKLGDTILNSVTKNDYLKRWNKSYNENLIATEASLNKDIVQVDSLHSIYKKALLSEALRPISGTNIDMSTDSKKTNKELQLFEISKKLNEELKENNFLQSRMVKIVNTISDFQNVGKKRDSFFMLKTIKLSLIGVGLMILVLLLLKLNRYLDNYKIY